jgi:para-nitrobenzyl esterase
MADTWIAFARTGNPNNPKIPRWPAYDLTARPVMVLDASPELVNDARGEQRRLLDDSEAYGNRYQR